MSSPSPALAMALAALCLACGREGRQVEVAPAVAAAAPADLTDVATLRAALARPPRELLPSFRLRATSSLAVTGEGDVAERLDDEALVERAPGGELHAYYGNSREYGRELYAVGGTVWVRPRYGKFHRRPPAEIGEAERVADETGGALAAILEVVLAGALASDGGAITVGGRPARKVILARHPSPPARAPGGGWRATVIVKALDGELVIDEATQVVLRGRVAAGVSFTREGALLEMTLAATHELDDVGTAIVIAPPPDSESSPTPGRSSEADDREELLGGLAAPARRAAPAGARP